jgi:hypothetical protein
MDCAVIGAATAAAAVTSFPRHGPLAARRSRAFLLCDGRRKLQATNRVYITFGSVKALHFKQFNKVN